MKYLFLITMILGASCASAANIVPSLSLGGNNKGCCPNDPSCHSKTEIRMCCTFCHADNS